tara:strand:- start:11055 stop:11303 length:249 start_codon:yes stop_codon:yes gene_type:complete
MRQVEFRIINSEELPPMVISMNEMDEPKVVINMYHKIWLFYHRKTIGGVIDTYPSKIDELLSKYLDEQRQFEIEDREMMNDG